MGDEKWTRRGPGSASGSFVPPPVVAGEPRTRAPLPRRWPRSDRRASQATDGGADQVQSGPAEEPGQQAQVPGAASAPVPAPSDVSPAVPVALQPAERQAPESSPQLPDNVRYLFRPVLNQLADPTEPVGTEPVRTAGAQAGTKAGTQKVDRERISSAGARSARDRAPAAAFQQTATA